jgi:hypothetical protein
MSRLSRRRHSRWSSYPVAPWAWWQLGLQTAQMLADSSFVIAKRTGLMAAAGPLPSVADRREFARMGSEKVAASVESANSLWASLGTGNFRLWTRAWELQCASIAAMTSLALTRTPAQLRFRQANMVRQMGRYPPLAHDVANASAATLSRAMKPIRMRAGANSKRLRRS